MPDAAQARRIQELTDTLRAITAEAASARSALCENELVIRLDNILALARVALAADRTAAGITAEGGTCPDDV